MRTIIQGKTFARTYKRTIKRYPSLIEDIKDTLRLLTNEPFAPQLETRKLKGKLSGSWSCSAGYDLRIIFDFVKSEACKEDDILLIDIGAHDEVY